MSFKPDARSDYSTALKQAAAKAVMAVVVTYNPDIAELWRLLDTIIQQVAWIVVVDNGSKISFEIELAARYQGSVGFIQNTDNLGVACGQNQGIDRVRQSGAEYVVLFDQDSLPANDLVGQLWSVATEKMALGELVAAIGPTNVDGRWNKPLPFVRVQGLGYRRLNREERESSVCVDHVISSGALIPIAAIDKVGGMIDELFIDYIDVEWGLRAAQLGLRSYGSFKARMTHSLGNAVITIGSRQITMHSPRRDYYLFRNAVWMFHQRHLPLRWKIAEGRRLVGRFAFYSLFGRPWQDQMKFMTLGIMHGLKGRTGRYEG